MTKRVFNGIEYCNITRRKSPKGFPYIQIDYEKSGYTHFELKCPQHFQLSMQGKYSDVGVESASTQSIVCTSDRRIDEMIEDINAVILLIANFHRGENITNISFENYNSKDFNVVIGDRIFVNHKNKSVSPLYGYMGHGKKLAERLGYLYKDICIYRN